MNRVALAPTPQAWPPSPATEWPEADRDLALRLDPSRLPAHVAIIMDGNGRWARQHGWMDRVRGHEAGADSVRVVTQTAAELGLRALTLFAFSTENWSRPAAEIKALMGFLVRYLRSERDTLTGNNIRLTTIGALDPLPAEARRELESVIETTAAHTGLTLNLALNYGARDELARAMRSLARDVAKGRLDPEAIQADTISARLDTAGLPDPDLLIRTSGEMRVSNFLLWQIAYAEIHVTPVLWPDFRRAELLSALLDYQQRERRYGGLATE